MVLYPLRKNWCYNQVVSRLRNENAGHTVIEYMIYIIYIICLSYGNGIVRTSPNTEHIEKEYSIKYNIEWTIIDKKNTMV